MCSIDSTIYLLLILCKKQGEIDDDTKFTK